MPLNLISLPVATALSVWLLVAGIGILRRRPWSRPTSLGWAVGKMLYAVPASVLGYIQQTAMSAAVEDALASDPGASVPTGFFRFFESLGAVSVGCGLLWAWALPIFLIIWFLRAPVKAEVERWALESRAAI